MARQPFFNGKDLNGWQAEDMSYWSVVDGAIVGTAGKKKIKGNQFLWHKKRLVTFICLFLFVQVPYAANAGIQFRSQPRAGGSAFGYQADVGKGWWGSLYHEHGRKILAKNKDLAGAYINHEDWNQYEILAIGPRIWLSLNGKITVAINDIKGKEVDKFPCKFTVECHKESNTKGLILKVKPQIKIAGFTEDQLMFLLNREP